MNPCKTVVSVLRKAVGFRILVWCLGASSVAAPVPLPEWVKPIESSLPRLSPEVISEVDEIRTFMRGYAESPQFTPPIKAQWESHNLRLVELREQSGQAMIWQYLKATSSVQYENWARTLSYLGGDRDLAAWLLPVVRFRIEWLKQALRDPGQNKYIERVFRGDEISETEAYLFQQGEFSDIENLNLLVDEGIKLKLKISLSGAFAMSGQERLQAQVKAMQEARNLRLNTKPIWQMSAVKLEDGVITQDALKLQPSAQNSGAVNNAPKPLGPRKPLPEIKDTDDYPKPWMVWQIWLFLIAVSAGLLCWLFRKPKGARAIEGRQITS